MLLYLLTLYYFVSESQQFFIRQQCFLRAFRRQQGSFGTAAWQLCEVPTASIRWSDKNFGCCNQIFFKFLITKSYQYEKQGVNIEIYFSKTELRFIIFDHSAILTKN